MHDYYILDSAYMKSPFKILQRNDSLPMVYESGEEPKNAAHNWDGADEDCRNSNDGDALLENCTSFNGLEMEYNKDGNPESCT